MAAYTSIDNPELYFQVKAYSGTGDDNAGTDDSLALTFDGSENMQPDLMWFKGRNFADNHVVIDSVRGVTKAVYPDSNAAETTQSHYLKTIDSDGMTLGDSGIMNRSGRTYVAWCWKESADSGFDIVSYTGNSTDRTISHSLSAVPKVIIIKNRSTTNWWHTYHHKIGNNYEVYLNVNNAKGSTDAYQSTDPTSSVFSLDDSVDGTNGDGNSLIAYLFAEKQGFSKFGSYTGNGSSSEGTFVYTGFRPAFILAKRTDSTDHWTLWDNKRESNPNNNVLYPSLSDAESTSDSSYLADLVSNGVKWRGTSTGMNASGANYIYMAFAEAPFVNSNGVPCNAR